MKLITPSTIQIWEAQAASVLDLQKAAKACVKVPQLQVSVLLQLNYIYNILQHLANKLLGPTIAQLIFNQVFFVVYYVSVTTHLGELSRSCYNFINMFDTG